jgi:hypothetical protein
LGSEDRVRVRLRLSVARVGVGAAARLHELLRGLALLLLDGELGAHLAGDTGER